MKPIRVLITDDHMIVREGLRLILETAPEIEVAGEASDGADCLRCVAEAAPDVVLMDLQMPGMDGITAINHLRRDHPAVAIVILTTFNEDALMVQGLRAGARGYLLKDTDRTTLLATIHAAARGETLLKPEIMQRPLPASCFPSPTVSWKCCAPRRAANATRRSHTIWASASARSRRISPAFTTSWASIHAPRLQRSRRRRAGCSATTGC